MNGYDQDDDARRERDEVLCHRIASAADLELQGYVEWVQDEVIDLLAKADALFPLAEGEWKDALAEMIDGLKDVNTRRLRSAKRNMKDKIAEVRQVTIYDTPNECQEAVDEARRRFEMIVADVYKIRTAILDRFNQTEARED